MKSKLIKFSLIFTSFVVVGYPLLIWYQSESLTISQDSLLAIFPALGLTAFTIMWLHIVGGVFKPWIEKYIDFKRFVTFSSILVLFLLILHPLLLLFRVGITNLSTFFFFNPFFISMAIIGWLMLISYDLAKYYKARLFVTKHWSVIVFISTLGFYFAFVHSFGMGGDLQSGPLRYYWIFLGLSAACATIYTYAKRS